MSQNFGLTQPHLESAEDELPNNLFQQLTALSEWANDQRPSIVKLSNESDRTNCMAVVRNFYEHVIRSFPSPQDYTWHAIQEKIQLVEASFKVFPLVAAAFCAESDFSTFAKQFFVRVFVICHILDQWVDVSQITEEAGLLSPGDLYNRAVDACTGLLRAWFCSVKVEKTGLRGWQVAKEIATELLALCEERLRNGPSDSWGSSELALRKIFEIPLFDTPSLPDVEDVLRILSAEQWEDQGEPLRILAACYLTTCVPHLGPDSLQEIQGVLSQVKHTNAYASLLQSLQSLLAPGNNSDAMCMSPKSSLTDKREWRLGVREVVQKLIQPHNIPWMDDDDSLSDAHPLSDTSPSARLDLARELARLPCALTSHLDLPCPSVPIRTAVVSIPTGMRVVVLLLDGPEREVTPIVCRAVYDALLRVVKHHTSGFSLALVEPVSELVMKGMKHGDRGVRLSAGRCFSELVKMYQDKGTQGVQFIDFMFKNLDVVLGRFTDRFRETAIITAGLLAKQGNSETLCRALLSLISQLGHNNPVLKGTAFMQLACIADTCGKSRYGLFQPYMDQFAIFIVDHMQTQPSLLVEYCSFLGVTRAEFFTASVEAIVPHLFATCNGPTISIVAKELSCDVASLFWKRPGKILAYVNMITIPGTRQKIMKFILSFFKGTTVTEHHLVTSSLIDLVSELVLNLGNLDDSTVRAAMHGLAKVEEISQQEAAQTRQFTRTKTLGAFLECHILGVITHMIGILQDAKEKRTLEEKKCMCRALGRIIREIGPSVSSIAPQIMALLQTMLNMSDLKDLTLQSWHTFLHVLDIDDAGAYIGPTGAAFRAAWPTLSLQAKDIAKDCLRYLVIENGDKLDSQLDDLADLTAIPELSEIAEHLTSMRRSWTPEKALDVLLNRVANENVYVAKSGLEELRTFLLEGDEAYARSATSGDFFHPSVGRVVACLLRASCRDGAGSDSLRMLAYDCLGILGAADPYRFDMLPDEGRIIVLNNFTDDDETMNFVLHLIKDILVGAYCSTSDIQYQRHLAYALQELLKICGFTEALVTPASGRSSVSLKARNRWRMLPKNVIETVTPLLKSSYKLHAKDPTPVEKPLYHSQTTYREWVQTWTAHLILKASGPRARQIFGVFPLVVRNMDVSVARHLLPHLVLNILIGGTSSVVADIRAELLAVLEDQVNLASTSTTDKKELSAQTVFMILDHINGWVRQIRLSTYTFQDKIIVIESLLTSINQTLMARAAFQCKAYARALMCFEQQIWEARNTPGQDATLQMYYERLHEIYAQLDEPDGMEGASTLILSPSLEHQIRQHESTGKWTSAQSCWEVNLQHDPDDLQAHLGLLRCLRNLGHYDTLRTHVEGVLTRHPDWRSELIGYQVESECMVGDWDKVRLLVEQSQSELSSILLARVLLAMREGDEQTMVTELSHAKQALGSPIAAVDSQGYRRYYESVLNLHMIHELDIIYQEAMANPLSPHDQQVRIERLQHRLSSRLESTLPSFRVREPILSIRRTALELSLRKADTPQVKATIGQAWLLSAKLARKAGYWHTAYSAVLQAQHGTPVFAVTESAKLVKASGEPLRALQELDNFYNVTKAGVQRTAEDQKLRVAKAFILRARWMFQSDRYEAGALLTFYKEANDLQEWESGQFHWGNFQDKCFKALSETDYFTQGIKMNLTTIKCYAKSIELGSKYIYETVPRLLTIWMDIGEKKFPNDYEGANLSHISGIILRSFERSAKYKWYAAFRQMLSRIDHQNPEIWASLATMIKGILTEYSKQALWLLAAALHSKDRTRKERARAIVGASPSAIVAKSVALGERLIGLCGAHRPVKKDKGGKVLKPDPYVMTQDFPGLVKLMPSKLLIPIQESLVADIPPSYVDQAMHQPFPVDAPMIQGALQPVFCVPAEIYGEHAGFTEEIIVMVSAAQPKKIGIHGSDGNVYKFLAKSKDDLRKDARLMDFDAILNKLLKSDSEARRRRLHIRTYGVVPLNEESGLIEWVPDSIPMRTIILEGYEARGIGTYGRHTKVGKLLQQQQYADLPLPDNEAIDFFERLLKL
ncbi:hypothetical protein EIP86_000344 [Pleurotus ostreatoroseus]|nr:hypothetical protein EIP86_000344 [Pleurotus ostreatoroseus]